MMNKLLPSTLAAALAIVGMLSAQADEVTTTTTVTPPVAPVQVLNSYMKPVVTQTKSVTTPDGNTQTSTSPLIMERHETVAVPTSETTTTTTTATPRVVEETTTVQPVAKKAVVRRAVSKKRYVARKRHHVAHKVVARKYVAPRAIATTKVRTVVEPQVIQQTQTVETKGVIVDRKDPSLEP